MHTTTLKVGHSEYHLRPYRAGDPRLCLTRIAPYDETDYQWAVSNQAGTRWTIYRHSPGVPAGMIGERPSQKVAELCKARDEALGLKRRGGIW